MRDILLYGLVYPHEARAMGMEDGLTDQELLQELREANGDDVALRINSRGGSADAAFAMNNLLQQYEGRTIAKVDGLAASAGTIVMLGADTVEIAENAAIMVHKAHVGLFGEFNFDDLVEVQAELNNYDKRIAGLYANRVGGTVEEWLKLLDGETYYTAAEAKEVGFADATARTVHVKMDFDPKICRKAVPVWVMKRYAEHQKNLRPMDQKAENAKLRSMIQGDQKAKLNEILGVA